MEKGNILVSQKNPRAKPIIPIMIPTLAISSVFTRPVLDAMAFGGVDMGNNIAIDAQTAMNEIMACVPPNARNEALLDAVGSAIPSATTIRIGISRAAVAELLIKLERK